MIEIGWPAPCGYTIFCDDIRFEVGNKPSFMGVYGGQLLWPLEFPAILPKFAFGVHYFELLNADVPRLELRIFLPGDEDEAPTFRFPVPPPIVRTPEMVANVNLGDDPRITFPMPLVVGNLHISQPGLIKVRMARGDNELVKIGALRVTQGPGVQFPVSETPPQI